MIPDWPFCAFPDEQGWRLDILRRLHGIACGPRYRHCVIEPLCVSPVPASIANAGEPA